MSRPRKSRTDLPPLLHSIGGRFYFKSPSEKVKAIVGAWSIPLGCNVDEARREWANITARIPGYGVASFRLRRHSGARSMARQGFVYAIQQGDSGPVKIGFVNRRSNIEDRMRALQSGSAHALRLLGYSRGSLAHENAAHAALSDCRMSGEWFRPTRIVMRFVELMTIQELARAIATIESMGSTGADGAGKAVDFSETRLASDHYSSAESTPTTGYEQSAS